MYNSSYSRRLQKVGEFEDPENGPPSLAKLNAFGVRGSAQSSKTYSSPSKLGYADRYLRQSKPLSSSFDFTFKKKQESTAPTATPKITYNNFLTPAKKSNVSNLPPPSPSQLSPSQTSSTSPPMWKQEEDKIKDYENSKKNFSSPLQALQRDLHPSSKDKYTSDIDLTASNKLEMRLHSNPYSPSYTPPRTTNAPFSSPKSRKKNLFSTRPPESPSLRNSFLYKSQERIDRYQQQMERQTPGKAKPRSVQYSTLSNPARKDEYRSAYTPSNYSSSSSAEYSSGIGKKTFSVKSSAPRSEFSSLSRKLKFEEDELCEDLESMSISPEPESPTSPLSDKRSVEKSVYFRTSGLSRGTATVSPAGERGGDSWKLFLRVCPEKFFISMEERESPSEVEAYFLFKHNYPENMIGDLFEQMQSALKQTKKSICVFLKENYMLYLIPPDKKNSAKCFLAGLVHQKMLLIWDLDNTLVDCLEAHDSRPSTINAIIRNSKSGSRHDTHTINVKDGSMSFTVVCKCRPTVRDMLASLARHYDMIICTMGMRSYAEAVVRGTLDPTQTLFKRIIAREDLDPHPTMTGMYVKDFAKLRKLGVEAGEKWTVVVDDSPEVWKQENNVLPVMRFLHFKHPDSVPSGCQISIGAVRDILLRLADTVRSSNEPWDVDVKRLLPRLMK